MLSLSEKAELAELAYRGPQESDRAWGARCGQFVLQKQLGDKYTVDKDGVVGLVLVKGHHAVIAFRGTELSDIQDLITNLKTWPVPNKKGPGKVHVGTQEALLGVWPQIIQILSEREVQSVDLVGHSLGGMLATLAAVWLYHDCENIAITGVTTFGSPPIGDKMFADALRAKLGEKLCDYVHSVDIIPRLITPRLMGFKRAGTVYYMPEGGGDPVSGPAYLSRVYDLVTVYSKAYSDWIKSRQFTAPGIESHSISKYQERLKETNL